MANKENIAYLSDMLDMTKTSEGAVLGNIPVFGSDKTLLDSGESPGGILNTVACAALISAFLAPEWTPGTSYTNGVYSRHGGQGYVCTAAHTSTAEFDQSKWKLVLTSSGAAAVNALIASLPEHGIASLEDLAPAYSVNREYKLNETVVKDGILQVCTRAGRHPICEFSPNATVETSVANRLETLETSVDGRFEQIEQALDEIIEGYPEDDSSSSSSS